MRTHMLAAHGFCVVSIDSRGSDNRGVGFQAHLVNRMVSSILLIQLIYPYQIYYWIWPIDIKSPFITTDIYLLDTWEHLNFFTLRNQSTIFFVFKQGTVEIEDQVEVLQLLAGQCDYMDLTRLAVTGWSYGGYLSLMALAQRPDIFK